MPGADIVPRATTGEVPSILPAASCIVDRELCAVLSRGPVTCAVDRHACGEFRTADAWRRAISGGTRNSFEAFHLLTANNPDTQHHLRRKATGVCTEREGLPFQCIDLGREFADPLLTLR